MIRHDHCLARHLLLDSFASADFLMSSRLIAFRAYVKSLTVTQQFTFAMLECGIGDRAHGLEAG